MALELARHSEKRNWQHGQADLRKLQPEKTGIRNQKANLNHFKNTGVNANPKMKTVNRWQILNR